MLTANDQFFFYSLQFAVLPSNNQSAAIKGSCHRCKSKCLIKANDFGGKSRPNGAGFY